MKSLSFLAASLLSAVSLSGCETTSFEKAPLVEAACDPGLVGHWDSVGGTEESDGDVQLDIAGDCTLRLIDLHQGAKRAGEATQLHVGTHEGTRYLWLDSAWSLARFDSDLRAAPGDVLVLRYSTQRGELVVNVPDDKAIAHHILDGEAPGSTAKDDDGLQNRITGGPHPKLLANDWFFDREELRFRRVPAPAHP